MPLSTSRLRKPLGGMVAPVLKAPAAPGGTGLLGGLMGPVLKAAPAAPPGIGMLGGLGSMVAPVLKALPGSGGLGGVIQGLGMQPPIMRGQAGRVVSDLQRMNKRMGL